MEKFQRDEQLQFFWQRRRALNDREWNAFYGLVYCILIVSYRHEAEHIQDFFTKKIWKPVSQKDCRLDTPIHAGALQVYFKNYLKDVARSAVNRQAQRSESDPQLLDSLPAEAHTGGDPALPDAVQKAIEASAHHFVLELEPWARWVLRYHYFGTPPIPLVRFRGHIPSYHQRCNAGAFGELVSKWMRSLRQPYALEDEEFMQIALEILRQQTLLLVKDKLPFQE